MHEEKFISCRFLHCNLKLRNPAISKIPHSHEPAPICQANAVLLPGTGNILQRNEVYFGNYNFLAVSFR